MRDFTQLSVRVAGWNPGTLSGGIGLTFSFVQSYSSTSGGASGLTYGFVTTQYVAMFRGRAGGVELCAGVYKMVNGKNVPITGQSTTITAMSAFSNTANPARSTTSLASRQYSRLGVSRSGNVIKLWIDNSTNVVHTVTDSVAPLGAGQVGVTAVGMNTVIYDDFTVSSSEGQPYFDRTGHADSAALALTVTPLHIAADRRAHLLRRHLEWRGGGRGLRRRQPEWTLPRLCSVRDVHA